MLILLSFGIRLYAKCIISRDGCISLHILSMAVGRSIRTSV